jgi:hypothetical protein
MPRRVLRVSRRAAEAEVMRLRKELSVFEGVVFSTFFSQGERSCLKTLLAGKARIVWILPIALPKSIPVAWTDAFLEERALWVSPFGSELQEPSRASCEQANQLAKRLSGAVN